MSDGPSSTVTLPRSPAAQTSGPLEQEDGGHPTLERSLCGALADLRTAREEAERASRMRSDFLAVMSHELRTPLNAIIGYEDLLSLEVSGPLTQGQRTFLERIRRAADQLLGLVNQILSLSQAEAGPQPPCSVPVCLVEILDAVVARTLPDASGKGLTLESDRPERPLLAVTDPGQVRQILLHLLSNAVKFTERGGITVGLRAEEGAAIFSVRDTGIGIAPADLERVFEPFMQVDASVTRQHGGTGLGLPISHRLARLLGGELCVTSAPGAGSTFSLHLPLAPASGRLPRP